MPTGLTLRASRALTIREFREEFVCRGGARWLLDTFPRGERGGSQRMRAIFAAVAIVTSLAATTTPARAESLPEMLPRLIQQSGWLRAHHPGEVEAAAEARAAERHEP